jgi:aminoglycoside phosphotransferase (APT) family kinase protein
MEHVDKATDIRNGEELDKDKIMEFLKDTVPGLSGESMIRQFPSGFSNLTYLVTVGDEEFVLRRPPFGKKAKTAHDMSREYKILKALRPFFPYCPEALAYTDDLSIMGCPFYIMQRLKGIILRKNLPDGLALNPDKARKLSENMIRILGELHSVDYIEAGLRDFGKPEGYVKRQVDGWSSRYRDAWTDDAPDYEEIMTWLAEKMPADTTRPCIIHNDFKLDNAVLDPDDPLRIIGILDWEMSTIGDPLMDLGNSLAYWVERNDPEEVQAIRLMPTNLEGMLTREEQVALYADIMEEAIDNFDYYFCFGIFRLAVIAQQIYYRFYHGQTKDKRFQMLIFAVKILEGAAKTVIQKSDL